MKKIIVSIAVAAIALSTTASALEDIKVNGQAKLWYESNDKGDNGLLNKDGASGEVVFKLGMTGKQGDVGFGTTVYQTSTMGIEGEIVSGVRTNNNDLVGQGDMFVGEAYVTAPMGASTLLKFGKQELNTPMAFTEKWNATPNTFDAAVAINSSVKDLTLIGAYVGQTNTDVDTLNAGGSWKTENSFTQMHGGAYALGALYDNKSLAVNFWGYKLNNILNATNISATAYWLDAGMKFGDAGVKAYVASVGNGGDTTNNAGGVLNGESTTAIALCANYKVSGWTISGAFSSVGEGDLPVANVATNFKKTKLPTAGVYTDGQYVAQPESTAVKVKAAGKVGETGLAFQVINNANDAVASKETTEIDLIVTQKVGDFKVKGILMNRSFEDAATDTASGANHARVIVSLDF